MVQILIFNHWCSVLVQLQQLFNFSTRLQNVSFAQKFFAYFLSSTFLKKSWTKNFNFRTRNKFSFLTIGAPFSFNYNNCSTSLHGCKTSVLHKSSLLTFFQESKFFMVNAILFLAISTLTTFTFTISPTLTTSSGCLIYLSDNSEIWTRPS